MEESKTPTPITSNNNIFDSFKYPVCVIGSNGMLAYRNNKFTQLFESNENTFSLDLSNPFSLEYKRRIALAYLGVLKGADGQCFAVMKSTDGSKIPVEIRLYPMFHNDSVSSILAFMKIVDDRLVSFNKSTSFLLYDISNDSNLFEFSPFPIIRINPDGEIIEGSVSFESFIGKILNDKYKKQNILFSSISLYDNKRMRNAISDILSGGFSFHRIGEIKVTTPNKEEKWINTVLFPIVNNDNDIYSIEIILEDFTKVRVLENKLNDMKRTQIAGDLSIGLMRSFNGIINTIKGKIQSLEQKAGKDNIPEELRIIEKKALEVERQLNKIQNFIGDENKQGEPHVKSLKKIIDEVISYAKIQLINGNEAKRKSIKFIKNYSINARIKADIKLLDEIFILMISKAASFINNKGTINIDLNDNGVLSFTITVNKEVELFNGDSNTAPPARPETDVRSIAERVNIKIIEQESAVSYSIKAVIPSELIISKENERPAEIDNRLKDFNILSLGKEGAYKDEDLLSNFGKVIFCNNTEDSFSIFKNENINMIITDYYQTDTSGLELFTKIKELNENVITALLYNGKPDNLKAYKNVIDISIPHPVEKIKLIMETVRVLNSRKK